MNTNDVSALNRALRTGDSEQAHQATRALYDSDRSEVVLNVLQTQSAPHPDALLEVLEAAPNAAYSGLIMSLIENSQGGALSSAVEQDWDPDVMKLSTIGGISHARPDTALTLLKRVDHLRGVDLTCRLSNVSSNLLSHFDVKSANRFVEPLVETLVEQSDQDRSSIRKRMIGNALYARSMKRLRAIRNTIGLPDDLQVIRDLDVGVGRFKHASTSTTKTDQTQRLTRFLVEEYDPHDVLSWYLDREFEDGIKAVERLGVDFDRNELNHRYSQQDYDDEQMTEPGPRFLARRLKFDLPANRDSLREFIKNGDTVLVERFCEQHPEEVGVDLLYEAVKRSWAPGMTGPILQCVDPTNEQLNRAASNMVEWAFEKDLDVSLLPLMQLFEAGLEPNDEFFEIFVFQPENGEVGDKEQFARTLRMILESGYRPPAKKHDGLFKMMHENVYRQNGGTQPLRILVEYDITPSTDLLKEEDGLAEIISDELTPRQCRALNVHDDIHAKA